MRSEGHNNNAVLSRSTEGWKQADEDKFDEAVAVVYDKLLNSEKFASDGGGSSQGEDGGKYCHCEEEVAY